MRFVETTLNRDIGGMKRLSTRPLAQDGVMWSAIGPSTIRKASGSCQSLSRFNEDLGRLLVTSDAGLDFLRPWHAARGNDFWFDAAVSLEYDGYLADLPEFEAFTMNGTRQKQHGWRPMRRLRTAKIASLIVAARTFGRAFFLDADSATCSKLNWWPLRGIAFVPAPFSHHSDIVERLYGRVEVPEPNSGVLAFSSKHALPLFTRWIEVYWRESLELTEIQNPMDQPPLRIAIHLEGAEWAALDPWWNCRGKLKHSNTPMPLICGGLDRRIANELLRATLGQMNNARPRQAHLHKLVSAQTETRCKVIHSHDLPKPTPWSSDRFALRPNARTTIGILELATYRSRGGTFSTVDDWRYAASRGRLPQQEQRIATGEYALEACLLVQDYECLLVVIFDDPDELPDSNKSMLDALIPLWPEDMRYHNDPRADRLERLGPPNLAVRIAPFLFSRRRHETYRILPEFSKAFDARCVAWRNKFRGR